MKDWECPRSVDEVFMKGRRVSMKAWKCRWRTGSVHGADINTALTSQPEKKPEDSNDLFQALRGLARWCQRCGHMAVRGVGPPGSWRRIQVLSPWGNPAGPCPVPSGARAGDPEVMVRRWSEPGLLQSGPLHEGGDVLVGGCAYCTNPRTLWSTPNPLPVDPDPRAVRVVSGLIVGLRLWSSLPLAPAHPAHRSPPAHRHPGQASRGSTRRRVPRSGPGLRGRLPAPDPDLRGWLPGLGKVPDATGRPRQVGEITAPACTGQPTYRARYGPRVLRAFFS